MNDTQELPTVSNLKEVYERIGARIIDELDKPYADSIRYKVPVKKIYEDYTKMSFIEKHFKTSVVILEHNGVDISFNFSINDGVRPDELISVLKEKIKDLNTFITDEVKGTHMEQYFQSVEEHNDAIEKGMKLAVLSFKKAFKHWASLLNNYFETQHNLIVEVSDINKELRINGLFTLDNNSAKDKQFYVSPQFVADSITKDGKSLEAFGKKADYISESINAFTDPVQKEELAKLLIPLVRRMPAALSSVKDMIKSCHQIKSTKPACAIASESSMTTQDDSSNQNLLNSNPTTLEEI